MGNLTAKIATRSALRFVAAITTVIVLVNWDSRGVSVAVPVWEHDMVLLMDRDGMLRNNRGRICHSRQGDPGALRSMKEVPMVGRYQIGKHLEALVLLYLARQVGHGGPGDWVIDGGRLYRTPRELEEVGALSSLWRTESQPTPVRVYTITPEGRTRLQSWHEEITTRMASLTWFLEDYSAVLMDLSKTDHR